MTKKGENKMPQTVYTIMVVVRNTVHYKATFYDVTYGLKLATQASKQILDTLSDIRIDVHPHYMSVGEFITVVY